MTPEEALAKAERGGPLSFEEAVEMLDALGVIVAGRVGHAGRVAEVVDPRRVEDVETGEYL